MGDNHEVIFIDTETTGLDPAVHKVWEVAVLNRGGDVLFHYAAPVELDEHTDLQALRINHYVDRVSEMAHTSPYTWYANAKQLHNLLQGKHLVGASVHFDMAFINKLFKDSFEGIKKDGVFRIGDGPLKPSPWDHKSIDIGSMVMGKLGWDKPRTLSECAKALGINTQLYTKHQAIDDARLVLDIYSHIVYELE